MSDDLDPLILATALDFFLVDEYLERLKFAAEAANNNVTGALIDGEDSLWTLLKAFSSAQEILIQSRDKLNTRIEEVTSGVRLLQRSVRASVHVAALKTSSLAQEQLVEKRTNIVVEILETERTYLKSLQKLIDKSLGQSCFEVKFRELSRRNNLDAHEALWDGIFGNLPEILRVNERFLAELETVVQDWPDKEAIADLFIQWSKHFFVYSNFASKFPINEANIAKILQDKAFATLEKNTISEFRGCYITPIQRLPRYELLLSDLRKSTPQTHHDYEKLEKAITEMKAASTTINSDVRKKELDEMVKYIQKNVHPEIATKRQLLGFLRAKYIHETIYAPTGVKVREHNQGYVFLFEDLLFSDKIFSVTSTRENSLEHLSLEDSVMIAPSFWITTHVSEETLKDNNVDTTEVSAVNCCIIFDGRRKWIIHLSDGKSGVQNFIESALPVLQCAENEVAHGIRKPGKFLAYPGKGEYCGWWKNGKPHGSGMFRETNGTVFKGVWDESLDAGYGKVILKGENDAPQATGWVHVGLGTMVTCSEHFPDRSFSYWEKEKLTKSDWEVLLYGSSVVNIDAGKPIIPKGEKQAALFKIRSGLVSLEGNSSFSLTVDSGIVGVAGLIGKTPFLKASAQTPVEVYYVPFQTLMKLATSNLNIGLAYTVAETSALYLLDLYASKAKQVSSGKSKVLVQGATAVYQELEGAGVPNTDKSKPAELATNKNKLDDFSEIDSALAAATSSSPSSSSASTVSPVTSSAAKSRKDKQDAQEKKFRKKFNIKDSEVLISTAAGRLAGKTGYGTLYLTATHLCLFVDQFATTKIAIHFADIISLTARTDIVLRIGGDKPKSVKFEYKDPQVGTQFSRLLVGLWEVFSQQRQVEEKFAETRERTMSGHTRFKSISRVRKMAVPQATPLSSTLGETEFQLLQKFSETEEYKDKQVIVKDGEVNQKLMRVMEGSCDVLIPTGNGTYEVFNTIEAGNYVAECCFMHMKSPVTLVANGNVTLLTVKFDYVNLLFTKYSEIPEKYYTYLATILSDRLEFLVTGQITPLAASNNSAKMQTTMTALNEQEERGEGEVDYDILGEDDYEGSESEPATKPSQGRPGSVPSLVFPQGMGDTFDRRSVPLPGSSQVSVMPIPPGGAAARASFEGDDEKRARPKLNIKANIPNQPEHEQPPPNAQNMTPRRGASLRHIAPPEETPPMPPSQQQPQQTSVSTPRRGGSAKFAAPPGETPPAPPPQDHDPVDEQPQTSTPRRVTGSARYSLPPEETPPAPPPGGELTQQQVSTPRRGVASAKFVPPPEETPPTPPGGDFTQQQVSTPRRGVGSAKFAPPPEETPPAPPPSDEHPHQQASVSTPRRGTGPAKFVPPPEETPPTPPGGELTQQQVSTPRRGTGPAKFVPPPDETPPVPPSEEAPVPQPQISQSSTPRKGTGSVKFAPPPDETPPPPPPGEQPGRQSIDEMNLQQQPSVSTPRRGTGSVKFAPPPDETPPPPPPQGDDTPVQHQPSVSTPRRGTGSVKFAPPPDETPPPPPPHGEPPVPPQGRQSVDYQDHPGQVSTPRKSVARPPPDELPPMPPPNRQSIDEKNQVSTPRKGARSTLPPPDETPPPPPPHGEPPVPQNRQSVDEMNLTPRRGPSFKFAPPPAETPPPPPPSDEVVLQQQPSVSTPRRGTGSAKFTPPPEETPPPPPPSDEVQQPSVSTPRRGTGSVKFAPPPDETPPPPPPHGEPPVPPQGRQSVDYGDNQQQVSTPRKSAVARPPPDELPPMPPPSRQSIDEKNQVSTPRKGARSSLPPPDETPPPLPPGGQPQVVLTPRRSAIAKGLPPPDESPPPPPPGGRYSVDDNNLMSIDETGVPPPTSSLHNSQGLKMGGPPDELPPSPSTVSQRTRRTGSSARAHLPPPDHAPPPQRAPTESPPPQPGSRPVAPNELPPLPPGEPPPTPSPRQGAQLTPRRVGSSARFVPPPEENPPPPPPGGRPVAPNELPPLPPGEPPTTASPRPVLQHQTSIGSNRSPRPAPTQPPSQPPPQPQSAPNQSPRPTLQHQNSIGSNRTPRASQPPPSQPPSQPPPQPRSVPATPPRTTPSASPLLAKVLVHQGYQQQQHAEQQNAQQHKS